MLDMLFEGIIGGLEKVSDVIEFGPIDAVRINTAVIPEAERDSRRIIANLSAASADSENVKSRMKSCFTHSNDYISSQLEKENFKEKMNNAASADRKNGSDHSPEFYRQMSQLSDDLYDCINKSIEKIMKKCTDEEIFAYNDGISTVDASDYDSGSYDYERLSKAKVACKEAIKRAVNDAQQNFEEGKETVIESCKEFLNNMDNDIQEFIQEFRESYDDYVSLDCEGEAAAYAADVKNNLTDEQKIFGMYTDINIRENFDTLIKELFDNPAAEFLNVQNYFERCKYDEDSEGCYCYEMDDAICSLKLIKVLYERACENLEKRMMDLYQSALRTFASNMSDSLTGLFNTANM